MTVTIKYNVFYEERCLHNYALTGIDNNDIFITMASVKFSIEREEIMDRWRRNEE